MIAMGIVLIIAGIGLMTIAEFYDHPDRYGGEWWEDYKNGKERREEREEETK